MALRRPCCALRGPGEVTFRPMRLATRPIALIGNYVELRYTENCAAAFSLLYSANDRARKALLLGGLLVAGAVFFTLFRRLPTERVASRVGLALILGGGVGNGLDRLRLGYVVDFVHAHYGRWHWPTFNVADVAISVGIGLLLLDGLRSESRNSARGTPAG